MDLNRRGLITVACAGLLCGGCAEEAAREAARVSSAKAVSLESQAPLLAGATAPPAAKSEAKADRSEPGREAYGKIVENAFAQVAQEPLSTFSIDVDTASYANVRRFLEQNMLPAQGRGPDRGAAQLLPLRRPRPRPGRRPVRGPRRGGPLPLERRPPAGPDRHHGPADRRTTTGRRATSSS